MKHILAFTAAVAAMVALTGCHHHHHGHDREIRPVQQRYIQAGPKGQKLPPPPGRPMPPPPGARPMPR